MRKILPILLVLLCVFTAAAALADSENLLYNGGFEEGVNGWPQGWQDDAWLYDPGISYWEQREGGYSGDRSALVENVVTNDARFTQVVQVTPGATYRLSGFIKAEGCDPAKGGANLSIIDCFGDFPAVYDTKGEWVEVTCYVRPGRDMKTMTVAARVGMYNADTPGKAWFDDISVVQVDSVPDGAVVIDLDPFTAWANSGGADTSAADSAIKQFDSIWPWLIMFAALIIGLLWVRERKIRVSGWMIFPLLGIAAVVRLYLMATQPGYETDMACFLSWSLRMAEVGPANFYDPNIFCDYPPGYMYPLWITGGLLKLLGVGSMTTMGRVLVKIMPLLFDIGGTYLLYRFAVKRLSEKPALLLAALYALSPAVLIDGAVWGQVDSVLSFGLLLCAVYAMEGKWHYALPAYAITVLMKPQALLAAPVALAALVMAAINLDGGEKQKGFWKSVLTGLGAGLGACVVLLIPFVIKQPDPVGWVIKQYTTVLGSYEYATLNTPNLFYLLGANWTPLSDKLGPATYGTLGVMLTVLAVALVVLLYAWRGRRDRLPYFVALSYIALYILGVKMHERYLFPALLLLLVAYVATPDRRILWLFVGFSVTLFVNCALVLRDVHLPLGHGAVATLLSAINLLLLYLAVRIAIDPAPQPLSAPMVHRDPPPSRLNGLSGRTAPIVNPGAKGYLLLALLTGVYAVSAFWGLGDTVAPQSEWRSTGVNETVTFDLGERQEFRVLYYAGISSRNFYLEFSDDGIAWTNGQIQYAEDGTVLTGEQIAALGDTVGQETQLAAGNCFTWQYAKAVTWSEQDGRNVAVGNPLVFTARYCRLVPQSPATSLFEVAFQSLEGQTLPIAAVTGDGARTENGYAPQLLCDEQQYVPSAPSYMNSMYFDEIYHGRTGYEMLHGLSSYEWTHPPLGKVLIMLGIKLFGMTPFGWRFSGTLIGVLMIPAMYLLGLILFKKPKWALFSAFLMAADMMHLAQTRIATIDSYSVFFVILMYACMFRYMQMNFFRDGRRTLIPLGLSGLFMGLGWASKWTCFYASVGLAVLFFWSLWQRYMEYRDAIRAGGTEAERVRGFWRYFAGTGAFCIGFFIIIPAAIYYYSYIPHFAWEGGLTFEKFWRTQESIFNYHATLVDNHPYKSPWYEWPLILKPIWFYSGGTVSGKVSSIMSTGNPAVWWVGFVTMLWMMYTWVKGRIRGENKGDMRPAILLISFASQFVPWMLVPRSMFIYHYFGSLPFVMLSITLCAEMLTEKYPKNMRVALPVYCGVTALLFVAFYPIATGLPVPRLWMDAINLLGYLRPPGWQWQRWLCY